MAAKCILKAARIEAPGTNTIFDLDPISGFGQVKDALFMMKVHQVAELATTQIGLKIHHSPDGDARTAEAHSTPIAQGTVSMVPSLVTGYCDTDRAWNGPIGEYLHPSILLGNSASPGQWAIVDLYVVKKPV